ncbi:MAG: VTC domain-containing protein, partial [Nitrospina sp.]|nr:VTC domain-containing protein [Nitrospina sp.]
MIQNPVNPSLKVEDFIRYEFKFPLDLSKREKVESEVANFMSFDGHVHPELSNAYYVRSLYYDNDAATNYYEKIDGVKMRRKFRLRTYGKLIESSLPIYLEEKNRDGDRVHKHRVPIDPSQLPIFYNPEQYPDLHEHFSGV